MLPFQRVRRREYFWFWQMFQYTLAQQQMSALNLQFAFLVPKDVIYEALTHPMKIMQYTRAPAAVEPKEGGAFSILDGKIQGRFISLRPGEYIKMEWKFKEWQQFSTVEIVLRNEEEDDECEVYLTQTKIPANEKKEKLEFGWKEYYFTAMSKILGYPQRD